MTSRQRFIGGVWRTATSRKKYIGGKWRTATRRKIYLSGAWHDAEQYTSSLTASASPSLVSGTTASGSPVTITSDSATVTPSGGLGPYAYNWDGGGSSPTSATSATTAFTSTVVPGGTFEGTAACTVTDSLGATAAATVSIFLNNEG